jgi:hypothetical protein
VIWTYFRPSAERGRIMIVEFFGSGSTLVSSFSLRSAEVEPFSAWTTSIALRVPTRAPPIRTSLPRTRPAALGTCAVTS